MKNSKELSVTSMRLLIVIIVCLSLMDCNTQKLAITEDIHITNLEPGKCYYSLKVEPTTEGQLYKKKGIETKLQKAFILEVIPPKHQEVEVKYSCDNLRKQMSTDEQAKHRIQIRALHTKFIIRESDFSRITPISNPYGFMYCLIQVPRQWKTISEKDLIGDSITIKEERIISEAKITKTFVKRKPKELAENQFYYEGGHWTVPKEVIYSSGGPQNTIRNIQKGLNRFGYGLVENNILDQATKSALIDFQRKNGLKEGKLNLETLEKLGISLK